jgi:hypothetical protein
MHPTPAWEVRAEPTTSAFRALRLAFLLLAVLVSAWLAVGAIRTSSQVPPIWPAGGLVAGMLLTSPRRLRIWLLVTSLLLTVAAYLAHGYSWEVSLGFGLSFVGASWLVRWRLVEGLEGERVALRDQGAVSRLVSGIAIGSMVAGVGCGLTSWLAGFGSPWLGAICAFGASAAAMMVLLPPVAVIVVMQRWFVKGLIETEK